MYKIFAFILFFLVAANSVAHKLNIFAYTEKGKLFVNTYFVDGTPCRNCTITLYKGDNKLLSDKTDKNGNFSTEMKWKEPIKIVTEGVLGHKAEFILEGDKQVENNEIVSVKGYDSLNKKMLQKLIDEELDKKLKYIKIYIGVATLLGIFGILSLFKRR